LQYVPQPDLKSDPNVIIWDKNRPLTWNDFQCTPVKSEISKGHCAMTASSMFADCNAKLIKTKFQIVDIQIHAYFIKDQSWKYDELFEKNGGPEKVLKHEQGHFDITEIYARRYRNKMKKEAQKLRYYKGRTSDKQQNFAYKESQRILQVWADQFSNSRNKYNGRYEKDTWYGTIPSFQEKFDIDIANKLKTTPL